MLQLYLYRGPNWILDPSSVSFWGTPLGKKGYKLFDLQTKKVFVSRNVVFYEHIFPFSSPNSTPLFPIDLPITSTDHVPTSHSQSTATQSTLLSRSELSSVPNLLGPSHTLTDSSPPSIMAPHFSHSPSPNTSSSKGQYTYLSPYSSTVNQPTLRRSLRDHHLPSYLNDYICNSIFFTNISASCFTSPVTPPTLSFSAVTL